MTIMTYSASGIRSAEIVDSEGLKHAGREILDYGFRFRYVNIIHLILKYSRGSACR